MNGLFQLIQCNLAGRLNYQPLFRSPHSALRERSAGSREPRMDGDLIHYFPSVARCYSTVRVLGPIASTCRTLNFVFMSCPKAQSISYFEKSEISDL